MKENLKISRVKEIRIVFDEDNVSTYQHFNGDAALHYDFSDCHIENILHVARALTRIGNNFYRRADTEVQKRLTELKQGNGNNTET